MILSMFFHLSSAVTAVVAVTARAIVSSSGSQRDVPPGWSLARPADQDAFIPLKFVLKQDNLHNLEEYLLDIADPQSANYGKHWSPTRVIETFRPSQDSVDTVRSWLVHDAGIDASKLRFSKDGGSIHLNVSIAEAENLLATEYYVYTADDDKSEHVGCHSGYSLPEHVSEHVDIVWPTVHFGEARLARRDLGPRASGLGGTHHSSGFPKRAIEENSGATSCDEAVTLDCLRALYNFNYTLVSADKNTVAVVELGENSYSPSDLDLFFKKYDPAQVGHYPTFISIEGGHLNTSAIEDDLEEATMDLQLLMGLLGNKQEVLDYQVGTNNSDPILVDALLGAVDGSYCSESNVSSLNLADCGNKPLANVVSISYSTKLDLGDPDTTPILQRQCAEFGKLSLMGTTFLVSSGDAGVGFGHGVGQCIGQNGLIPGNERGFFVPQFPASCPYVTAVGATQVVPGHSVTDPESASFGFPSGGGFSNTFPIPKFQQRAVKKYLKHHAPSYGDDIYNRTGRGYPDVAANGFPTAVVLAGNYTTAGGTSASAPIFAALIAAVNDARIAAGKGPVGWINPAIYSHRFVGTFNDIKNGSNPGCGTDGFPTARGWDPVTGLGTPNFAKLLKRFVALP